MGQSIHTDTKKLTYFGRKFEITFGVSDEMSHIVSNFISNEANFLYKINYQYTLLDTICITYI